VDEGNLRKLLSRLGVEVIHKNHAGWLVAKCPFAPWLHEFGEDRNPSFMVHVNPEGYSGFNCFTCRRKGNLSSFLETLGYFREEDYHRLGSKVLMTETPDKFGEWDSRVVEEQTVMDPLDASLYLSMYPLAWEEKISRVYLRERGVTQAACTALRLLYDPDQRRVLFPVISPEGDLYGFTGRTVVPGVQPKVRDYAGLRKGLCLLGGHLYKPGLPILLVEGLFALARLTSLGAGKYCTPLAVMGNKLTDAQADILTELDEPVYLLFDEGLAGDTGTESACKTLVPQLPVFVCLYPRHAGGDPDNLRAEDFPKLLLTAINGNEWI